MKTYLFFIFVCSALLFSCTKIAGDNTNITVECAGVKGTKIIASKTIYNPGDDIHLGINASNPSSNDYITWYSASGGGQLGTGKSLDIFNCGKGDEGLYIMSISNADCGRSYSDSIYITVKNAADTAPCTLANNAVTFSAIPDISPASVMYGADPSYGTKSLYAYASYGYPELHVYFNQYWNNNEPEDGRYSVGSLMDLSGNNVYETTITCLYSGINFNANSGDVYVSHNNGKLVVQFCSLNMTGYNGTSYSITATGKLTAL
jgi:hypothetical protein